MSAALMLAHEGKLDLKAPPHKYLPELAPLPVTIDQMMRNCSGLPDFLELLRLGGHGLEREVLADHEVSSEVRLDWACLAAVRYHTSFKPSSRSSRPSIASSLATASHEPVASVVTETSRPTVDSRASTRLQPLSAMRRVTDSSGDSGCVV